MAPPELFQTSATDLTAAIRAKQLSPVELTEAFLARIEEMYDNEYGGAEQTEPTTPLPSSIEEFLQGLGADLGDDEENR